jgi:hypothetical protein
LAEGQVTILDSGPEPGQNVVVDGADRLSAGQAVIPSAARQRSGKGGSQGPGVSGGPSAPANAGSQPAAQPGAASGKGSGKPEKREKP